MANPKGQRLGEGLLIFLKKVLGYRHFVPHDLTSTLTINKIETAGRPVDILAAFPPHSQVTTLDLGHNWIRKEGASAIAAVLPNSKLTTLDLGDNSIGNNGVEALANLRNKNGEQIEV